MFGKKMLFVSCAFSVSNRHRRFEVFFFFIYICISSFFNRQLINWCSMLSESYITWPPKHLFKFILNTSNFYGKLVIRKLLNITFWKINVYAKMSSLHHWNCGYRYFMKCSVCNNNKNKSPSWYNTKLN